MMMKKEEGHNHWWKRRCKQERDSHRAWEIPPKKNSKERDKRQISLGTYDRELGLQIFLVRGFEKPKHHRIFSPRRRDGEDSCCDDEDSFWSRFVRAKWRIKTRGWKKLWITTTKLALPDFVSCPDFSSRKSKPGIWKGWWIRTRVDLFFVFSSGISGGTKTKKQKRQSRHIYRIRSWRSPKKTKQDFFKFLFSHLASSQFSPSYDFLFFSFLFFFTHICRLLDISPLLNIIKIISSNNYICFTNYNFFQCRGRIFIYFIIYFSYLLKRYYYY